MKTTLSALILSFCGLLAGCSTATPESASAANQPCAQCLVCKKNADLACLNVTVDADTPRYDYNGKTYYFCSNDCRDKFIKNPQTYLAQK